MKSNNSLIIISGPAGVGKTTIAKYLLKTYDELESTVTYTTRDERDGVEEDKTIHYIDKNGFEQRIDQGEFLEWAEVHENYYGTHKKKTLAKLKKNSVILNIDIQGAKQIIDQFNSNQIVSIFLAPESIEQIKQHLKDRDSNPEEITRRLKTARDELNQQDDLDFKVVNREGELEQTKQKVEDIIQNNTNLDKTNK
jgi:guanylate kinase